MTRYIAEIGLNHLGDPKLGFQLVKKAVSSGVHGISMQILPTEYYDNSKPWKRKIDKAFYEKVVSFLKKKKKLVLVWESLMLRLYKIFLI